MRSASTTVTCRPARVSSHAVQIPAIPPPITATSTSTSSVIGGYAVNDVESIQYDSAAPETVVMTLAYPHSSPSLRPAPAAVANDVRDRRQFDSKTFTNIDVGYCGV